MHGRNPLQKLANQLRFFINLLVGMSLGEYPVVIGMMGSVFLGAGEFSWLY